MYRFLITLLFFATTSSFAHSPKIEESLFVSDPNKASLNWVKQNPLWIVDHVSRAGYELYGPRGLWKDFNNLPLDESILAWPMDTKYSDANYPPFVEIEKKLKELAASSPNIAKLISIGKSTQGRDLWVIKISDNVESDENEPEFKYISSMHGDEITGRELMMSLLTDLLSGYAAGDTLITSLIDNTEIYIIPSMNPDGSEVPKRSNANGADLNRDFPDFSTNDNKNDPTGREPETQAIMKFQDSRNFSLSANFHGGAEVVNYPWDTLVDPYPMESLVIDLSLEYASRVPYIFNSTEFPKGITNGYAWYEVNGGMQDWSIFWYNDLQLTIELSDSKYPAYSKIAEYYKSNKDALLQFIALTHQGAGITLNDKQAKGTVEVFKIDGKSEVSLGVYSIRMGQFYKVLEPGEYRLSVVTDKSTFSRNVSVQSDVIKANGNFATE